MSTTTWLKTLNQAKASELGAVRHVLLDFDGTLSVLRQGWEPVMQTLMLESISPGQTPPPDLVSEVHEFIDRSTGKLTILQMQWLAAKVQSYGMEKRPLSAGEYKKKYLQALMLSVSKRLEALESGTVPPETYLIRGASQFVAGLAERGVTLYIASGSDHLDVVHEAQALGLAAYFGERIYGALDESEANGKERVIQRILDEHHLAGKELLVVGDGPVEIIEGSQRGALSLGVASDEIQRAGWNQHKIERLTRAGADFLAADFEHAAELITLFAS